MRDRYMLIEISRRDSFVRFGINKLIGNKKALNTRFKDYLEP